MDEHGATETKDCRQCAIPIPVAAKLCKECGSFQDWRGHLSFSNSILALLVALISVISISISNISPLFSSENSEVVLSNAMIRGDTLLVVATNTGTRPGIVESVKVRGKLFNDAVTTIAPTTPNDAFIRPGAQQSSFRVKMNLNYEDSLTRSIEALAAPNRKPTVPIARAYITVKQANGDTIIQHFDLSHADASEIFSRHAEICDRKPINSSMFDECLSMSDLKRMSEQAHANAQKD